MGAAISRDTVSQRLVALWESLLGRKVSVTDDFFEAGGDSLTAIKMVLSVQSTYHVDLDIETFLEEPRISRLTEVIVKAAPPGTVIESTRPPLG